ncbi:hypothetical protein [Bacillus suaedae]|nr:hypothetical protein [Bacillus suaedae]
MTLYFILFTISIKRRHRTGDEIERLVRRQHNQRQHEKRMSRFY